MAETCQAIKAKFQSTLPRRERPCTAYFCTDQTNFNPRSREGSDSRYSSPSFNGLISIHAPAKGATRLISHNAVFAAFQSTLPRRERLFPCVPIDASFRFQSTLPRRERPFGNESISYTSTISIHAPAKGATEVVKDTKLVSAISIHAPAKGATSIPVSSPFFCPFQSTLPRRERRYSGYDLIDGKPFQSTLPRRERRVVIRKSKHCTISIHAPAKGATPCPCTDPSVGRFQSTLPRRERRGGINMVYRVGIISIHAPAKGATDRRYWKKMEQKISIHAPAKGATSSGTGSAPSYSISIHAPAKGATLSQLPKCRLRLHFNPRSREGSDIFIIKR